LLYNTLITAMRRLKKPGLLMLLVWLGGCSSTGYYLDALSGHAEVLNGQRPLDEVLADPTLDQATHQRLQTMQAAREFASRELALPDNDSYRGYTDLGRDYVLWNVVATPAFSLKPKQWCFIFVGCMSYRGYYRREQAEAYAEILRAEGLDVQVAGVPAYSTLGWTADPLLNTMLYHSEARRVGLLFHELAHQQLYIKGDTSFNESFASAAEQEGVRRWFAGKDQAEEYQHWLAMRVRDQQFKQLILQTREKLQVLYRQRLAPQMMHQHKAQLFGELKQAFAVLKKSDPAFSTHDHWMAQDLNNAHLALIATYYEYVPALTQLLTDKQGDLPAFYQAAKQISEQPPAQRHKMLRYICPKDVCTPLN